MARFVISGTGTDIGKTVFAAGLAGLIGADYWKPIQTGVTPGDPDAPRDAGFVARMTGARIHPETVVLPEPLSPHRAAELAGVTIDPAAIDPPDADPLVIEGAGGVLVPVTRDLLSADLFARWGVPVIVCAATGLGTMPANSSGTFGARMSRDAVPRRRRPATGSQTAPPFHVVTPPLVL